MHADFGLIKAKRGKLNVQYFKPDSNKREEYNRGNISEENHSAMLGLVVFGSSKSACQGTFDHGLIAEALTRSPVTLLRL